MALVIRSNSDSMTIRRGLLRTQAELSTSIERLSSGLRINSGRDDPAGLGITTRLGARVRSVNQAIRNVNTGISAVQTAEDALSTSSQIVERIREIAVQSINDTNTSSDRASLQSEVGSLIEELDRISSSTEFNTFKLLDGSFRDKSISVGIDADDSIRITIPNSRAGRLGARAEVTGSAVNNAQLTAGAISVNGQSIAASDGADDTLSSTLASASAIAKAAAVNALGGLTGVLAVAQPNVVTSQQSVTAHNLTAGGFLINGIDIGVVTGILDDDSGGLLTAAINSQASATGVTAELDSVNGRITLTASDGRNLDLDVQTNRLDIYSSETFLAPLRLSSNEQFVVGGASSAAIGVAATLFAVDFSDTVATVNVATKAGANDALAAIDAAVDQISRRRGDLGAIQNRLTSAVEGLQSASENLSQAKSRIEDADFAQETAILARSSILEQAGVALLAQANSRPEIILSLLA